MKILHTSDWHLGRALYGIKRHEEFASFLDWLIRTIEEEEIDILLIAGDIFDSATPGNRERELYFSFLSRVRESCCRHVVIIAGNHDSPSLLAAPRELLTPLSIHVVAYADNVENEILILRDAQNVPELLVCAVPYLRDRDIRVAEAGEEIPDKQRKIIEGIRQHYAKVVSLALRKREELGTAVPLVATGHLFTKGGKTVAEEGLRDLYVGSLIHLPADSFPDEIDYLALGHLHIPQAVKGHEHMRYSGSPLAMSFGEAQQEKSLCLVSFQAEAARPQIRLLPIPVWQPLERIRGHWADIKDRIAALQKQGSQAWLEIICEDPPAVAGNIARHVEELVADSELTVCRISNPQVRNNILQSAYRGERLAALSEEEVFRRCLEANAIPAEEHEALLQSYREALIALREES